MNHKQTSPDRLPPASRGNKERQARSKLNITYPITWQDKDLEQTYNTNRPPRAKQKNNPVD